jgi:anti-sigma B factor antagonist
MSLTATIRQTGGVSIVDLKGRITLGSGTGELRQTVVKALENGPNLILNLAGVDYMDSAGLGEMVGAYTSVTGRGGKLKLLNPQKKLSDLLQLTRLYTLFETFEDEQAAIKSF